MDIYDLIERYKKDKERKIRIVCPVYGRDWVVWQVFVGLRLLGQYKSMWQAEQFVKSIMDDYPGYELEVISWEKD